MLQDSIPILGAHVSIAGGFLKAVERCESIGANGAQIFIKSNQQWAAPPIPPEEAKAFRSMVQEKKLFFCAHAGYLINLASSSPDLWKKSIDSFVSEIKRAEKLGLPFIVLHPGSCGSASEEAGLDRVVEGLMQVIDQTAESKVAIALETTAGQGSSLGSKLENLAYLLKHCKPKKRFCVCVDTAHIFEAGYPIHTEKGYNDFWNEFELKIGIERLVLIHCNDSKTALGSRVDRHEHLGKGQIGIETFRRLMQDKRLIHIPKILETPKGPDLREDIDNLNILRSMSAKV